MIRKTAYIHNNRERSKKMDVKRIINEMTLEEKAGMCSGKDSWRLKSVERLGVPEVMVSDGPHGLRKQMEKGDHLGMNDSIRAVCFPTACATACSFDRELLHRLGEAIGEVQCRPYASCSMSCVQRDRRSGRSRAPTSGCRMPSGKCVGDSRTGGEYQAFTAVRPKL